MEKHSEKPSSQLSGDRLRILLDRGGVSPKAFADQLEITPQALNNWFTRGIPAARVQDVATALGVTRALLMGGTDLTDGIEVTLGPWKDASAAVRADTTVADFPRTVLKIPIYERKKLTKIYAEHAAWDQYLHIERNWLLRQGFGDKVVSDLHIFQAVGDHMAPTINDGDLMLAERLGKLGGDTMSKWQGDGIYTYIHFGTYSFRRVQLLGRHNAALLLNDNEAYRDQEVNITELALSYRVLMVLNCRQL